MDEKLAIAKRFEEFGIQLCGDKHGWRKQFAEKLGISSSQMTNLLAGRDSLGASFMAKLKDLGADVDYIKTGRAKAVTHESGSVIQFSLSGQLTPAEKEKFQRVIAELEKVSKTDPEAAEKIIKIMDTIFRK